MPPDSGGICIGVDKINHRFAPGLPPGRSGGSPVLSGADVIGEFDHFSIGCEFDHFSIGRVLSYFDHFSIGRE